jgi:hypothetical protein
MDSPEYVLASSQLASNGTNLLIVVAVVVLLAWVHRILRQFYLLYRLNVAISTGQVVRLQTSHMTATERDMLFGEMSMLWRTNMQQQLLRARRISRCACKNQERVGLHDLVLLAVDISLLSALCA